MKWESFLLTIKKNNMNPFMLCDRVKWQKFWLVSFTLYDIVFSYKRDKFKHHIEQRGQPYIKYTCITVSHTTQESKMNKIYAYRHYLRSVHTMYINEKLYSIDPHHRNIVLQESLTWPSYFFPLENTIHQRVSLECLNITGWKSR